MPELGPARRFYSDGQARNCYGDWASHATPKRRMGIKMHWTEQRIDAGACGRTLPKATRKAENQERWLSSRGNGRGGFSSAAHAAHTQRLCWEYRAYAACTPNHCKALVNCWAIAMSLITSVLQPQSTFGPAICLTILNWSSLIFCIINLHCARPRVCVCVCVRVCMQFHKWRTQMCVVHCAAVVRHECALAAD